MKLENILESNNIQDILEKINEDFSDLRFDQDDIYQIEIQLEELYSNLDIIKNDINYQS